MLPARLNSVDSDQVYVLMTDKYRISRNIRAQWYLQSLNTSTRVEAITNIDEYINEIDIISTCSSTTEYCPGEELRPRDIDITTSSKFSFFSRKYSFVYILDMSTSVSNVDIQHSTVLTDELFSALAKCFQSLVQPFYVPGSRFLFFPEIYLSVLVYNPFYSSDTNNVIVHGYKLCVSNIETLLGLINTRVYKFIEQLRQNIDNQRMQSLQNFAMEQNQTPNNLVPADMSLVNMIRFGLLTLNLLPDNSHESIVIVTDGNISFPDARTLESALAQLRLSMITCSFIQIGSPPHPDSSFGFVPYNDFMKFLAIATFGAHLSISPDYVCDFPDYSFNVFHQIFLVWSFHYDRSTFCRELRSRDYHLVNVWSIDNPYFGDDASIYEQKDQHKIRKRQLEMTINASLPQVLSYRLREGFTIKRVIFKPSENNIEMSLLLPWRHNVNIEYIIKAPFQPFDFISSEDDDQRLLTYEIVVETNYSFLYDVTCSSKKKFKSPYRSTIIKQFIATLKTFCDSDKGIQFHQFAKNELYRSMPESIKKGVPLFYLPPNTNTPVIGFSNDAHLKFAQYWKPICMLDVNTCQKSSLHTLQVNILLKHDTPLPEFLYQRNPTGRYDNIQCNQAMSVLNVMLKEWSSFVLLENHSYIKLIDDKNNSSCSFYLVRIISQPPCIVLHLAFIGGTSSCLRNQIVNELTYKLKQCKLPQRNLSSSLVQNPAAETASTDEAEDESFPSKQSLSNEGKPLNRDDMESNEMNEIDQCEKANDEQSTLSPSSPPVQSASGTSQSPITTSNEKRARNVSGNINCFVLLDRPIERMLIRYEKIPEDFYTCYKYEEDIRSSSSGYASLNLFQTLTRYLFHKRFIWNSHHWPQTKPLTISSVSRILSVLTMKRIQEGFHLAYNDCGIVNLVMELNMRDSVGVEFPCLIQYIIFSAKGKDSLDDNDVKEASSVDYVDEDEQMIVTECWVEPQNGQVINDSSSDYDCSFLQGLNYEQISSSFYESDLDVISTLLTYEHLRSYTTSILNGGEHSFVTSTEQSSINGNIPSSSYTYDNRDAGGGGGGDVATGVGSHTICNGTPLSRFNLTRYSFNLLNLLSRSQQAIIKFSMLCQPFEVQSAMGSNTIETGESVYHDQHQTSIESEQREDKSEWADSTITTTTTDTTAISSAFHLDDCINMILHSEFLLKLHKLHDRDLEFNHIDTMLFIELLNQRLEANNQGIGPFFTNMKELAKDQTILFKCFCKQISVNCLVMTILPFSYNAIRKLCYINGQDVERNPNLVGELEHNSLGQLYGSLVVPVFVYKITFQSLSMALLKPRDNDSLDHNKWNQFFDYSTDCKKLYLDPNMVQLDSITQSDEIALEHFVKRIETLYWNSFTNAVYRALQYGFEVDQRDVNLVLEKISLKFYSSIDITKFMIYTCKHLKLIVNAYLEKYPKNSITDFVNYILSKDENGNLENFDLLPLRNLFSDSNCTNCQTNGDVLKNNFVALIETHFTPVPNRDNYYYYDYEIIQKSKFSFGQLDMNRYKENLFKFYESIENGSNNLFDENHSFRMENGNSSNIEDEFDKTIKDDNDDVDGDMEQDDLSLIISKPFFVGFSYSFSLKSGTQIFKTTSIPTCYFELFSALSESIFNEIELENLRVQLNIEILTQNIEQPIVNLDHFNQSSSIYNDYHLDNMDTLFANQLYATLDEFQVYKYTEFDRKINWLITDEIVSVSHHSFTISPDTLEMVVTHIQDTGTSNTSLCDKVELQFIVDDNQTCLTIFQKLLKELKFSNFQLCQLGKYFFVIHRSMPNINTEPINSALVFTTNDKELLDRNDLFVINEDYFNTYQESIIEYTIESGCKSNLSPNFWLILILEQEHKSSYVSMYFHSRQNVYVYGLEIFNQLKKSIELLCKKINQKLLLDQMHETKECEDLLISIEDKDPFIKSDIRTTLNATPIAHLEPELEIAEDNKNFKLVKKNFQPGSFSCDVVWEKHFPLHPRLNVKEGLNAIRQVLSSFTVSNRSNLYVYREKSGNVFYLRIYEIDCAKHVFNEKTNNSISSNQIGDMGQLNNCYYDNIINSNDSYNDSNKYDSDKDDDSIASFNLSKPNERCNQQCILLNVHGLSEPENDIKRDMIGGLQKRIDEAVLKALILILVRNQSSKFTYEDVCFVQGSTFENFYFTVNDNYAPYMLNIKYYIRQNLWKFMYNPKYADSNAEYHFKLFKNGEFHCVMNEDVFVLHCQNESGKDINGVACVILSIVSKDKLAMSSTNTFMVNNSDLNDFMSGNFENITSCYPHERESCNVRFYINFQVWYSGKIDIDHLHQKLIDSIRNSLWDFNLEFKIFKLHTFGDSRNFVSSSVSEPSTPKKHSDCKRERRSGLSIITGMQKKLASYDIDAKYTASRRSTMNDQLTSPQTAMPTTSSGNFFDFDLDTSSQLEYKQELSNLTQTINNIIKPWLDFGKEVQVNSLKKCTFSIVLKNSILTIIEEFRKSIKLVSCDMNLHFLRSTGNEHSEFDMDSFSPSNWNEGDKLMILLRHEPLWNARTLGSETEHSFIRVYKKCRNEKSKLDIPPTFSSDHTVGDSSLQLNSTNETISTNMSDSDYQVCIAPRQKFLLLYIEDRYITLYLYNWSNNLSKPIVGYFSSLVLWHNCRSLLLQSLVMQKAGIFHHLPFKRYTFEEILLLSKIKANDLSLNNLIGPSTFAKDKTNLNVFRNTDLLLKYTNHYDAITEWTQQSNKESKDSNSQMRSDFVFDSRSYSYIFSSFLSHSTKNLYDYFNDQLNSHYNQYIKDLKDLSKVWQLHGAKLNSPIMEKITSHVKKYGRLSHFCLTPFLFSHRWRYSIALIRDHTMPNNTSRSRHMSGGHILKTNSDHEFFNINAKARSRRKSGPPNILENSLTSVHHRNYQNMDECLEAGVCPHYIQEYVQYLQSLGFSSIKSLKNANQTIRQRSFELDKRHDRFKPVVPFGRKSIQQNEYDRFYSIKTLMGGFFLFEIGFCEPYVYSYLYSFDSSRFTAWTKSDSFDSHMNATNFLDELDSIKVRMHLHSFTYDYHLRAIHSYISGRQLFFNQGYHLISFLDDFIKYYQKAPNYARNHIYSDLIQFESKRISPDQLYNYIIGNNKLYGMDVFGMKIANLIDRNKQEFVLIHLSSHRIPYNDENNISQEDNFDVGVLISFQRRENFFIKDNNLCLKFFVLLTSQRELFPKLFSYSDAKGAFRTIRSLPATLSTLFQGKRVDISEPINSKLSLYNNCVNHDIPSLSSFSSHHPTSSQYCGICDEKINYLGYFNAHEIVMRKILIDKVEETKLQLNNVIAQAEIDCRRDCLWNCLIPDNAPIGDMQLSLDELNELLTLVKSIRLDQYDESLGQFYFFNYQWYKSLASKLELKFESTHRKYLGKDNLKMAFFKTSCKDCFILFGLRNLTPIVEFDIVFKKSLDTEIDKQFLRNCNPQYHELVEEFINACTSHMWSVML